MSGCGWHQKVLRFLSVGCVGFGLGLPLLPMVATAEPITIKVLVPQNGVYLYGEANTANQPGQGYLIFQQSGQRIVGATYYPQSEYTCFVGQRAGTQVHLQSFEAGAQSLPGQDMLQISLPKLYPVSQIGPSERQILSTCQREAMLLQSSSPVTLLPHP